MSSRPRPKATAAATRYASTASGAQFDLRNPNTLAATSTTDEDYDAETAAILNLDEISGQSRGVKRNAVNLDGYDSDSSNEGFGGGKEEAVDSKKKKTKEEDNDDDDMFGEDYDAKGDAPEPKKTGKSKKDVRFLDIKEIEGQEDESDAGSSSDEEEEPEDDEIDDEIGPGGKKKNAPKMDKFNMKDEMEEGKFDDQGNFVRKAIDPDAVHDSWLEGVNKKEMKKAKEAQDKRDQEARQKRREEDELITSDLISDLILCLEKGETVLEALARLNTGKKATRPKKSWQKKKGQDMEIDASGKEPEDPKETMRKEQIEKITTAADRLLSRGFNEIYDETRAALTRLYRKETNEPWVEPVQEEFSEQSKELVDEWEYKWSDGQGDGQIHGPYRGTEMKGWKDAGYFQEGVVFRRKGEGETDWTRLPDF
ncbi:hypothetical protein H072_3006 [Dactylellina haptotyla CBS 200.50]|uniref:GYF domain-containing protein n=1 Tax=Dactylellina haptotyla (strain CBS 200.50) TaxID=1284197 RepID=S8BU57_DACHA|nr:hypothetical protein H072_3006 [Dactylellina haptotyla CBS 200.50]